MLHFVLYGHLRRLRDAVLVSVACVACGGILMGIAITIAAGPRTPAGEAEAGPRSRDDGAWAAGTPGFTRRQSNHAIVDTFRRAGPPWTDTRR